MSSWAARAKVHFLEKCPNPTDKTDERGVSSVSSVLSEGFCENTNRVSSVSSVPAEGKPEKTHSDAPSRPACLSPKLHAASVALDDVQAGTPPGNPDRWCWPLSSAMNGKEIDLFTKRLDKFFCRNMPLPEAERLADLLVLRDRERNTQHACLECTHLRDVGTGWRCSNWRQADISIRQRDNQLPADLAMMLQRCPGFVEAAL